MKGVVQNRVGILGYLGLFCPKQGQGFKPSATALYPNMGQVRPQGHKGSTTKILVVLQDSKDTPASTPFVTLYNNH